MTKRMHCLRSQFIPLLFSLGFAGWSHSAYGQVPPPAGTSPTPSDWVVRNTFEPTAPRLIYTAARAMGLLRGVEEFDRWFSLRYEGSGVMHEVTGSNPTAWMRVTL